MTIFIFSLIIQFIRNTSNNGLRNPNRNKQNLDKSVFIERWSFIALNLLVSYCFSTKFGTRYQSTSVRNTFNQSFDIFKVMAHFVAERDFFTMHSVTLLNITPKI